MVVVIMLGMETQKEGQKAARVKPVPPIRGRDRSPRMSPPGRLERDMLWVYKHPEEPTKSMARRRLQEMFKEDTKGFVAQMERMRAQRHMARKALLASQEASGEKKEGLIKDEPTERVLEILAGLMDEVLEGMR